MQPGQALQLYRRAAQQRRLRVVTNGPCAETAAVVSATIMRALFFAIGARLAILGFGDVFTDPLGYKEAPELMCLDLYRDFDFNTLGLIAAPVKIDLLARDPESILCQ